MKNKTKQAEKIKLQDNDYFDFLNGLWTGKKPPFTKAVVIRNTNFSNDGNIGYSNVAVLNVEVKQLEKRKLLKGDIIIERSGGGPKQPVGRVVYFDKKPEDIDYSFSNFTSTIRVKDNNKFDSKFVFYFLHDFYLEGKTDSLQRRTTGIRNLDFNAYKEAVIFPPIYIQEQKAIARILSTIQNAIFSQEELIVELKELKQSMMHHLFTHGTKDEKTKMTEIGKVPESWEIKILDKYLEKTKTEDPTKNSNEEFIYIDVSAVSREFFKIVSHKKLQGKNAPSRARKNIKTGDIIFATVRPTLQRIAIIPEKYNEQICSTGYCVLRPNKELDRDFLFHYLCSDMVLKYVEGLQSGVSYPAIRDGALFEMNIPFSPMEEQIKIGKTLSVIDKKIESTHEKLLNYQSLFKTLLQELMSGNIKTIKSN